MILPNNTPPAVEIPKATTPKPIIFNVSKDKNVVALAVAPTQMPNKIVTIYNKAFDAVANRLGTTPDSLIKFPSINIPIKEAHEGTIKITTKVTKIGNKIFSNLDTSRNCSILTRRSFLLLITS